MKLDAEIDFRRAVVAQEERIQHLQACIDRNGLPAFNAYVRQLVSQLPEVFELDIKPGRDIQVVAQMGGDFVIAPLEAEWDGRWTKMVMEMDEREFRRVYLSPPTRDDEDDLLERFWVWCQGKCPENLKPQLATAENNAMSHINYVRMFPENLPVPHERKLDR